MKKEDIYNAPKYAGVYMFRNTLNNKCYIGQSIKLRKRLQHHINNYENNRYDAPIYRAFKKYGLENFELKILISWHDALGYQTKKMLDLYEKRYIEEYNSMVPNGYNQTAGGDGGIEGYKFTDEQKSKVSKAVKEQQNDGRNLVYCYNIETNRVITASSLPELGKILGIKIYTGAVKNKTVNNKYIIARTKEEIQKNIASFKSGKLTISGGKYSSKLTDEMKEDILNGIREKDFIIKYKVCRKTYSNYKKQLIPDYKRKYKTLIDLDEFAQYLKEHSIKECAEHFNISCRRAYKYKNKIKDK